MKSQQLISYLMLKHQKSFLNIRNKQGWQLSSLLFDIVLGIIARVIRQEKEIKAIHFGEEAKLYLLTEDIVLYIENPKE